MLHSTTGVLDVRKRPIVPIITYHSVVDVKDDWQFRHLSCPVSIFESHLKALRLAKFHSISLQQLYAYMTDGVEIPPRAVVLTFDDGYLDNWVYAYPLLKKYGFSGTIFITPDFVDPDENVRPNLEDVWNGRLPEEVLPKSGFLSWQEMREMESSGNIDIQSHGLTHTWYYTSPEIIDFHHPGDVYPWLSWNARPDRKCLWMVEDQRGFVPWGTPVYLHEKSLAARRYFPDDNLGNTLIEYVADHGQECFFQREDWRYQLEHVVKHYRQSSTDVGRFETNNEYEERLYHELVRSKEIIETKLGKVVNFLCWPGGGYSDISVRISKDAGYLASTHSSWDRSIPKNRFGEDASLWSRISIPAYYWNETWVDYKGGVHLFCLMNAVRGIYPYKWIYRLLKVPFKLAQWQKRY